MDLSGADEDVAIVVRYCHSRYRDATPQTLWLIMDVVTFSLDL